MQPPTRRPARPGTAIALHARALPPPSRSLYVWLGVAVVLATIAGIGFKVPVVGMLLAAACSFALLRTASKATKPT
ncbi:hypothetical protein [Rhodoferax sp. WC2427]|uniref:hypothetical protein n=1 Tax=Rhodoferax sp. WC2427 TaxID=3234144 RepID=UPI00346573F7